jgi:zinc transport system permease protein
MFDILREMFAYTFLVRAFVVGVLVSLCAALLGVSLVLKRYSMIGDGLSHVGFGSLAVATAINAAPLSVAVPVTVAAAFLLLRISGSGRIKGDAAIALISTASLALGVVVISQTTGMNTDVCNYLFGSILAMNKADVRLSIALSLMVLVLFVLFYHKLFAITFDETFARAGGLRTGFYNMLIAFLTAITIVLGMRMMGALLISSLIVFPALTSMRLFKTFRAVTISAALVSLACFFTGLLVSYLYAVPTGAGVVMINVIAFILFWIADALQRGKGKLKSLIALGCVLLIAGCEGGKNPGLRTDGTAPERPAETAAASGQKLLPAAPASLPDSPSAAPPVKTLGTLTAGGKKAGEIIEIKEKMFIAQTNEIYLNPEDYLGRTIKLEGLFKRETYWGEDSPYCFVLRYGPGCCGSDGNAGFEVAWVPPDAAAETPPYPAVDEWVEAVGTLSSYEEDGYPYLYLALSSLKTLDQRGAEFVTQ